MKFLNIACACILCVSFIAGCKAVHSVGVNVNLPYYETKEVKHKRKGPPPHAPAHGYRHKNKDGVILQFDNNVGAYIVIKMPGIYFYNGFYMRITDDHWEIRANFHEPWRREARGEVPDKLKKAKGHGKGKKKKKKK
ncbi:MAG: hypothetical protein ACMUJM_14900 [bacterium]